MDTDIASTGAGVGLPHDFPAELYDCVQVNLAVLAERWHGPGAGLALGACLRFRPVPAGDGLPSVEPDPVRQLAEAPAILGFTLRGPDRRQAADIEPGPGRLVVADAFGLPWVPYAGKRHLEHSFLAEHGDQARIGGIDAYHNETPWGAARPCRWTLDRSEFAALPGPVVLAEFARAAAPRPRASTDLAPDSVIDRYVRAYAEHPERERALRQLTLQTWLLTRARALHAAFLRHTNAFDGAAEDAVARHVRDWESLTEQAYLAHRRVERGRAEPRGPLPRLAELLRRDREIFGQGAGPAEPEGPGLPGEVRRAIASVAAEVLGIAEERLLAGEPLTDTPSFNSFRMVEIVERLETRLGVEFDPDALVPENLHDVDTIARVLLRSSPQLARVVR
ncbi:acyl carrier protein [Amycolatopsis sp. WGS_07]|uniref:acyl carrier protein n=1 Tax=Amycolatopsis sp. WGS_07 TaxID=3076764 RepID=UPI003873B250